MEDVLALLNISTPYNERVTEISTLLNKADSKYKKLNLTVISSTLKYDKTNYIITPSGLQNSKRGAKDGIVLFGYEKPKKENNCKMKITDDKININTTNTNNSQNETTVNDFIFPVEHKNEDSKNLYEFPNFAIYYDIKDDNYYIKDFNTGVGALMKIKKYKMDINTLINVGSNYLVIYLDKNKITVKIFNHSILENNENAANSCESKIFEFEQDKNKLITIGRSQKCDIIIEDMMLSKIQASIEYNASEQVVYLYDGDTKKESTNGTWVFILNPVIIESNFLFKAEKTLFAATIINSK